MGGTSIRLGVDIGGTFTDIVLEVGENQYSTKVLTTYAAPEDAIVQGMVTVAEKAGVKLGQMQQIVHGTTLATNALIERRGAKTALVTTKGFRDVIEMRTESRFEQYDLNLQLPEPLLPRHQRYVLDERISAAGDILVAIKEDEIVKLAAVLRAEKYESIAVGLIHSYVSNAHEKKVRDILQRELPGVAISLSSEVSPQMREYERFSTVTANAYIKPMMKSYLSRLRARLAGAGVNCPVFLMHSGGGVISIENAAEFPVRLVESGPAGGAVFAAHIAARYGLDKVLSFDMGGTTAKICLIKNQTPKTSRVFEAARAYRFKKGSGMPLSIPVIDMVEIGAGGGSIAHIDSMRQIRVGPESASSEPGPACYGRGGARPAVTDADLILGRLDPDNFAGGSIRLEPTQSEKVVKKSIAEKLNLDLETAAFGVSEVVDENMANAARIHAVENGEDLSEYTMIAFGGAAPLHAGRLCEKLGVQRFLVPPGAGVGSAIGFLRAPFSFEATKSIFMKLSSLDREEARTILQRLEKDAIDFVRSCDNRAEILSEHKLFMRYAGQGYEIPIFLPTDIAVEPDAEKIKALFERHYETLFGRIVEGMDIEITVWAVNATTPSEYVDRIHALNESALKKSDQKRTIFDPALSRFVEASVFNRAAIQVGEGVAGPAAITEDETTIILPSSRRAIVQSDGCVDVVAAS